MPDYEDFDVPPQIPIMLPQSDFMSRSRIIYFASDFTDTAARGVVERLLSFNAESTMDDIILIIDSQGGSLNSYLAIYDTMTKLIHCDVATVCLGQAMSAGQMLLMSGTKGKRFITENSKVLVHQLSSGTVGKLSEMEKHLSYAQELGKIMKELIVKHTKITKKELDVMMRSDTFLDANDALKFGIVDHIIKKPDDLYSKLSNKNLKVRNVIDKIAAESTIKKVK
jgi:ATP-dependent Clp protease protease subunit